MKGKNVAVFALGAATGFVGLVVVAIRGTIKLKNPTYVIHHCKQPCKILFTNRSEAEEIYSNMLSTANSYGGLSIRDYYDICGVEGGGSYTDTKYGWTKEVIEAHARVVQEKMGYVIKIPDAKYLY